MNKFERDLVRLQELFSEMTPENQAAALPEMDRLFAIRDRMRGIDRGPATCEMPEPAPVTMNRKNRRVAASIARKSKRR